MVLNEEEISKIWGRDELCLYFLKSVLILKLAQG